MQPSLTPEDKNLVGGLLCGLIASVILFGIVTPQTITYFQNFSRDKLWLKLVVGGLWFCELLQIITTTYAVYTQILNNWHGNDVEQLVAIPWTGTIWQLTTVIAALATQICLIIRLRTLLKKLWLPVIIFMAALGAAALGIWALIKAEQVPRLLSIVHEAKPEISVWLGLSALVDSTLAYSMTMILRRRRTGVASTDRALSTMIMYAVSTGFCTACAALTILFGFAFYGFHAFVLFVAVGFAQLYTITLLAVLHGRSTVKRQLYASRAEGISIPLENIPFRASPQPSSCGRTAAVAFDMSLNNFSTDGALHGESHSSDITVINNNTPSPQFSKPPRRSCLPASPSDPQGYEGVP